MVTVVGGEEDVGVIQFTRGLELLYQVRHHLVDGQHRLQALPVTVVYLGPFSLRNGFELLYPGRLVGDILLVKGRGPRGLLIGEGAFVTLRRGRGAVRRRRCDVREEGLVLRGS